MKDKKWATKKTISLLFDIPIGGVNRLLAARHQNGLSQYISKLGKKLLINVDGFEEWLKFYSEGKRKGRRNDTSPYQQQQNKEVN